MIAVFDNFIEDEKLLAEIELNKAEIFKDPGTYKWYDGWWNSPADNTVKEIIKYAWGDHCPISNILHISGFEYWTGLQTADTVDQDWDDTLPIHFDKDEAWWEKTGEIITPTIGSVYYPAGQDFEGGELAIFTDGPGSTPEVVKAKPNRLIIFNAGQDQHMVNKVLRGTRQAIAINLWHQEPFAKTNGDLIIE